MTAWVAPEASGPVTGSVSVPGSKSATARSFVLAALSHGPSTHTGVLDARDSQLLRRALEQMGVGFADLGPGVVRVTPPPRFRPARIDCGLAGTVMRFVPPIAAHAEGTTLFFGDPEASARPVAPVLSALRQAGALVDGDALPFSVTGHGALRGGRVVVDASASSQFISALLLAGARCTEGLEIVHRGGPIPSRPYLRLTTGMLAARGVRIETPNADSWRVTPGLILPRDETIEPDLINAAVFLTAALVTGGRVEVPWPDDTLQPAEPVLAALEAFGGVVERSPGRVALRAPHGVQAADVDLSEAAELTCVLAAAACLAPGASRIRGVGHIRAHETDRLAALTAELSARGAAVAETPDGLSITPGRLTGGRFGCYADHRMAHAGAVLGLAVPGIELDDIQATTKTMPGFAGLWERLVD